jgi:anti-sigma-K factor RskA
MTNASEDRDVLAGEYVIGALEPNEARAIEAIAEGDPLLAAAITSWQDRLAPLGRLVRPVDPPEALWTRLEEAIAPVVIAMPTPEQRRLRSVWRSAGLWRGTTVGSLALAAGFAGLAFLHRPAAPVATPPIYVAQLAPTGEPARSAPAVAQSAAAPGEAGPHAGSPLAQAATDDGGQESAQRLQQAAAQQQPGPAASGSALAPAAPGSAQPAAAGGFMVVTLPDGSIVVKPVAAVQVPAGKELELWAEPPSASGATALGMLPPVGLRVAGAAVMQPNTKLMVSLEPQGGAPGGQPTGPVIYSGTLSRVE